MQPRTQKSPQGSYDLLLRDIPGDVFLALEALADAEGRKVGSQARKLLLEAVRRRAARQAA